MIGFVGLGNMGHGMAASLLKKGHDLVAYDVRQERVDLLVSGGARPARSAAEVARAAEVVMMSLPSPSASWEVLAGEKGILAGGHEGLIVVELSTISPDQAREMAVRAAERGLTLLDAGVSGGVARAEQGRLTIMVGGSREAFDRVLPVLQAIGENIYYVGPSGAGMVVKLVNNAIAHVNVVAAVEGLALGVKAGIPAGVLAQVIGNGTGRSYQFESRVAGRLLKRNLEAGMKLHLTHKDSVLACDLANQLGVPLFVTAAAHSVYQYAMNLGLSEMDYVAIAKIWEEALGVEIAE